MKPKNYLFDTHALVFWVEKEKVSPDFIDFFDRQGKKGNVIFLPRPYGKSLYLKKRVG